MRLTHRAVLTGALLSLAGILLPVTAFSQTKEGSSEKVSNSVTRVQPEKKDDNSRPKSEEKKTEEKKTGESPTNTGKTTARKDTNPRRIRVFLMDGSVIAGELSVDTIEVQTEFGTLTVPVEKVVSITPGLDSHTKLSGQIKKLIEDLGSKDYKSREDAHKELLKFGPPVRDIVAEYTDDKNAERKRHASEIVAKLDEQGDDFGSDDEDSQQSRTWVRHDTVVTPNFTIAGKVSPSVFQVKSKYGPLKISLNDIQKTEQEYMVKETVTKKVTVPGQSLVQRGMKSSGIRVNAGDTITIAASGRITLPPWGSSANCGPDGNSGYGSVSLSSGGRSGSFFIGTLVARVSDTGSFVKVGSKTRFVAKKSGVLKFGVAMNPSYAGTNYYYAGNFTLRVKVDPKK